MNYLVHKWSNREGNRFWLELGSKIIGRQCGFSSCPLLDSLSHLPFVSIITFGKARMDATPFFSRIEYQVLPIVRANGDLLNRICFFKKKFFFWNYKGIMCSSKFFMYKHPTQSKFACFHNNFLITCLHSKCPIVHLLVFNKTNVEFVFRWKVKCFSVLVWTDTTELRVDIKYTNWCSFLLTVLINCICFVFIF